VRFRPVGADALLVEVGSVEEATALYRTARRLGVPATDIVLGARTVLFDGVGDVAALEGEVRGWSPADEGVQPSVERPVEVPTVYDGPDLDAVARAWDTTTRDVVAIHTGHEMRVAFCGFAPGFPYCTGLPAGLRVPRLDTPRTRVAPGSVALADEYTGVYPAASPGGWRLIGRTELVLWDPGRTPPATLAPGTLVRFVEVAR
jgi:KipI family sensor histidine kinase inhibitor